MTNETLYDNIILKNKIKIEQNSKGGNMSSKSCLIAIKNKYLSLTGAEKCIADFITNNSEAVTHMSVAELAERAGAAKSAVIRCCKSLGFDGYSELKINLAGELSKNKELNYIPYIYPEDNSGDIMEKIFSANIKTLHDTIDKLDRNILNDTVELMKGANMIYIYAIGTSSGIAADFQYRLMQIGYNALCVTDVPAMKISTLNIKKGDVAIGISHSGRTVATIEALKLARENGAKTVCITSHPQSEITKHSDYPIEIYCDEINYPMEAISARIAHISVIDTITIALSAMDFDNAIKRSKRTHELINTIRY